jgi:hypothetical protein
VSARVRLGLIAVAVLSLVVGIAGGLARFGVAGAPSIAITHHAAFMIAGFLGTVISLERAVALGRGLGYGAPIASAAGAVLLLAGFASAAAISWIAASLALVATSVAIVRRQPLLHTVLLAVASAMWLAGNVGFALGAGGGVIESWFGFLILTIAAERLELTRLLPRRRFAVASFRGIAALLIAAILASFIDGTAGGMAFGVALTALASWLWRYDLARRTIHASGFARFAAAALLAGYAWLALAGLAWVSLVLGQAQARDLALHGVALGFVFSMILGHAPIVVPAIARVRMRFHARFYVPLALLHASLAVRVIAGGEHAAWRAGAACANALAIALFAVLVAASLLRARHERQASGVIMEGPDLAGYRKS